MISVPIVTGIIGCKQQRAICINQSLTQTLDFGIGEGTKYQHVKWQHREPTRHISCNNLRHGKIGGALLWQAWMAEEEGAVVISEGG